MLIMWLQKENPPIELTGFDLIPNHYLIFSLY